MNYNAGRITDYAAKALMVAGSAGALAFGAARIHNGTLPLEGVADAQTTQGEPPSQEFIDDCVEEAFIGDGVFTDTQTGKTMQVTLNSYNPAELTVGAHYKKGQKGGLRKWVVEASEQAISDECEPVIKSRDIEVDEIYRGRVNTTRPVTFSGKGEFDQTKTTTLKRRFKGIVGPRNDSYTIAAKVNVTDINGVVHTESGKRKIQENDHI